MADNSKIEWTDHTVNFWIGCAKVSLACDHCYAERDWAMTGRHKRVEWGPHGARSPTKDPLAQVRSIAAGAARRGRRERVFVNSLSDWADNHKSIAPEWRAQIFEAARLYPGLDFLLLTKRPQNIAIFLPADWGAGYTNVWLGTTVENQQEADRRIPDLLATPAAVRFVSAEPLLAPVSFTKDQDWGRMQPTGSSYDKYDPLTGMWEYDMDETGSSTSCGIGPKIDWVIVGGESGAGARPMHPDWARAIRDQCEVAGVPFFFKQWGEFFAHRIAADGRVVPEMTAAPRLAGWRRWEGDEPRAPRKGESCASFFAPGVMSIAVGKKAAGRLLDGREHNDMPGDAP